MQLISWQHNFCDLSRKALNWVQNTKHFSPNFHIKFESFSPKKYVESNLTRKHLFSRNSLTTIVKNNKNKKDSYFVELGKVIRGRRENLWNCKYLQSGMKLIFGRFFHIKMNYFDIFLFSLSLVISSTGSLKAFKGIFIQEVIYDFLKVKMKIHKISPQLFMTHHLNFTQIKLFYNFLSSFLSFNFYFIHRKKKRKERFFFVIWQRYSQFHSFIDFH